MSAQQVESKPALNLRGRVKEVCVSRLKSFLDFSNVRVSVCYEPADGENPDEAFNELVAMVEGYAESYLNLLKLEKIREKIGSYTDWTKEYLEEAEEQLKQVEKKLEEAREVAKLVREIRETLDQLDKAEKGKKPLAERIRELLRGGRSG